MIHPSSSAKATLNHYFANQPTFIPPSPNYQQKPATPTYRPDSPFQKSSDQAKPAISGGQITPNKFKPRSESEQMLDDQDSNLSLSKVLTKIQQNDEEEKSKHQYRPGQSKISKVVLKQQQSISQTRVIDKAQDQSDATSIVNSTTPIDDKSKATAIPSLHELFRKTQSELMDQTHTHQSQNKNEIVNQIQKEDSHASQNAAAQREGRFTAESYRSFANHLGNDSISSMVESDAVKAINKFGLETSQREPKTSSALADVGDSQRMSKNTFDSQLSNSGDKKNQGENLDSNVQDLRVQIGEQFIEASFGELKVDTNQRSNQRMAKKTKQRKSSDIKCKEEEKMIKEQLRSIEEAKRIKNESQSENYQEKSEERQQPELKQGPSQNQNQPEVKRKRGRPPKNANNTQGSVNKDHSLPRSPMNRTRRQKSQNSQKLREIGQEVKVESELIDQNPSKIEVNESTAGVLKCRESEINLEQDNQDHPMIQEDQEEIKNPEDRLASEQKMRIIREQIEQALSQPSPKKRAKSKKQSVRQNQNAKEESKDSNAEKIKERESEVSFVFLESNLNSRRESNIIQIGKQQIQRDDLQLDREPIKASDDKELQNIREVSMADIEEAQIVQMKEEQDQEDEGAAHMNQPMTQQDKNIKKRIPLCLKYLHQLSEKLKRGEGELSLIRKKEIVQFLCDREQKLQKVIKILNKGIEEVFYGEDPQCLEGIIRTIMSQEQVIQFKEYAQSLKQIADVSVYYVRKFKILQDLISFSDNAIELCDKSLKAQRAHSQVSNEASKKESTLNVERISRDLKFEDEKQQALYLEHLAIINDVENNEQIQDQADLIAKERKQTKTKLRNKNAREDQKTEAEEKDGLNDADQNESLLNKRQLRPRNLEGNARKIEDKSINTSRRKISRQELENKNDDDQEEERDVEQVVQTQKRNSRGVSQKSVQNQRSQDFKTGENSLKIVATDQESEPKSIEEDEDEQDNEDLRCKDEDYKAPNVRQPRVAKKEKLCKQKLSEKSKRAKNILKSMKIEQFESEQESTKQAENQSKGSNQQRQMSASQNEQEESRLEEQEDIEMKNDLQNSEVDRQQSQQQDQNQDDNQVTKFQAQIRNPEEENLELSQSKKANSIQNENLRLREQKRVEKKDFKLSQELKNIQIKNEYENIVFPMNPRMGMKRKNHEFRLTYISYELDMNGNRIPESQEKQVYQTSFDKENPNLMQKATEILYQLRY